MLHEFLTANRAEVIRRCREKVAKRLGTSELPPAVDHGVPLFLQQLIDTLRNEESTGAREVSTPMPAPVSSEIGRAAALHGVDLLRLGYSVDQVVHDYGDVCQAVTELAAEIHELISVDEFRTLNRCLDMAIADAVTSFGGSRQTSNNEQREITRASLHDLLIEQQRLVDMAIQAFTALKGGRVGPNGATGKVLMDALLELQSLDDRARSGIRGASAMTSIARH